MGFMFRIKWIIQFVMSWCMEGTVDSQVVQLWCQCSFLVGMNGEDRQYILQNWDRRVEEEFLIKLPCKAFDIKQEPSENCEEKELFNTSNIEQYDEDEALSTVRQRGHAIRKRPRIEKCKDIPEEAEDPCKVEDFLAVKEESPHQL